jgi:hypothetical protein
LSKVLRETPAGMSMDVSSQYGNTLNPHDSSSVQALSIFMNDNTVQAALRKGFLLSNLRLKSIQTGSEYEYIVFNIKDVMMPHRIEEIIKRDRMLDMIKASELRGHNSWKQDAPKSDRTITSYIEIVSAKDFPASKLFLTYSIHLPSSWALRTGNITDGDNLNTLGNFGYDENARWGGLQGSTHISSACPGFITPTRILSRPLFRGLFHKYAFSASTRLLLNVVFVLLSVTAAILGAVYPFWIVPALVIYFVGSGDLSAHNVTVVTKNRSPLGGRSLEDRFHTIAENNNEVCLNHLVNLSFDVKDTTERILFSPTADQPVVFFQVYSCGLFQRSVLEGYGYFMLPGKAGSFEVEVETWKVVGNVRSRMHEFFVGDHVKLKEHEFPGAIDLASKTLNKFGVLTHAAGSVKFRGQVIVVDPKMAIRSQDETVLNAGHESGRKTNRSVADILSTYRSQPSSRKPALTNFGSKLSSGAAERPSVRSILEGINASAKASRATEVLARIRGGRKPLSDGRLSSSIAQNETDEAEHTPLLSGDASKPSDSVDSSSLEPFGLKTRKEILEGAKNASKRYDDKNNHDDMVSGDAKTPRKAANEEQGSTKSTPREIRLNEEKSDSRITTSRREENTIPPPRDHPPEMSISREASLRGDSKIQSHSSPREESVPMADEHANSSIRETESKLQTPRRESKLTNEEQEENEAAALLSPR